jgi:hypothetical protein
VTPTHPDLDPDRIEQARRELGLPVRPEPPAPKAPMPPWRLRVRRSVRSALRPVYSRLADAVAERQLAEHPAGDDVGRLEAALTRVEAELELLRGQVAAQQALLAQLDTEHTPNTGQ